MDSFITISLALLTVACAGAIAQDRKPYPESKRVEVKETLHGVELTDPYRWLEDQESPETRAWLNAQIAYTEETLRDKPCREQITKRLSELVKIDSVGMPISRGGYYFYSKRGADEDLSKIYRRKGLRGKEEVLVDPVPMSPDKTTTVGIAGVSHDGKLLAYSIRKGGEDETEVRFLDLTTMKELPDRLPRQRNWGLSMKPDKSGFYYVVHRDTGARVYYHQMGTDVANDPVVFGEGYGPEKIVGAGLSEDGKWLLFTVFYGSAARKTELYVQNVKDGGPIVTLVNDIDAQFYGGIGDDTLYIQTDWEAPNRRILKADLNNPARENWKEIVPEQKTPIQGFSMVNRNLFIEYLEDVKSRVKVHDANGKYLRDMKLPAMGSVSGISGRWDESEAFYGFSTFHIPGTTYRVDLKTGRQTVWHRAKVPVESDKFEVEQVFYESKDKTRVPMFIVHRKGLKKDGSAPTILYGYGGFNSSMTPFFSSEVALWIEAGGVYAVPALRGGGEYGEAWHRAGMGPQKQNTFDDFVAAAEYLIKEKFTRPAKLAISGGSNGGLLVGAAMTQRPELFQAVICSVPLLDMIRYHQFLVARFWVPEYGSSEDPEQFKTLLAYSPYHNVKKGVDYPATLFITGDADTRVAPLHARKMAALLQWASPNRPVLLQYDVKSGHSGGKPISKYLEEATDKYAFLFWQLGMDCPFEKK